MAKQYIVIYGNPVAGFSYVGPFFSFESASRFVENDSGDWWIQEIASPPDGDE